MVHTPCWDSTGDGIWPRFDGSFAPLGAAGDPQKVLESNASPDRPDNAVQRSASNMRKGLPQKEPADTLSLLGL